jgi:hypothetical protein
MVDAILHQTPPPASDYNPAIGLNISRAIHKAMAKNPLHRYSSAKEFSETLQKAFRNEPIEFFDQARIQPRIQRATKAFEQADYQFAAEILNELEAEGLFDPAIASLQRQVSQVLRQKTIHQLLESARTRIEEEEITLGMQKIQESLQLDPNNAEALTLLRHSKKLQWLVNFRDQNNYDLFALDKKSFYRTSIRNGKKEQALKAAHSLDENETLTLQIVVTPDSVLQQVQEGGKWVTIDDWKFNRGADAGGKFGFYLPGKDQVAFSQFSFKPQ